MALIMKKACCGKSLRTVCLFVLYFNLIVYSWGLWSCVRKLIILEIIDFIAYFDIFLKALGCLIFLSSILTIYKEKPSLPLLSAAVWFLLVYVVYSVYSVTVSIVNGSAKKICYYVIEDKAMRFHDKVQRDEFIRWMKSNYSLFMLIAHVLVFVCVVFELYSALVCYSYREDLKQMPAYGRPPRVIHIDDKEANISAPYQPNTQFVPPQYPTQPANYPILPPQCNDEPPKYFYSPTQNYPLAPPPYEVVCK